MQPRIFAPASGCVLPVLLAQGYQRGHLALCDLQFPSAPVGQVDIGDFVVGKNALFNSSVHNVVSLGV